MFLKQKKSPYSKKNTPFQLKQKFYSIIKKVYHINMKAKQIIFLATSAFFLTLATSCSKKSGQNKITLTLFSNLPDRVFGQGGLEQKIIDNYTTLHPEIEIKVETLNEAAYKTKFKAYCQEQLPDIVSIWGQKAFLEEAVGAGLLAELNEDDYADYDFFPGSLDGFTYNGKLYGLPRNTDIALLFYNEKMFYDYRWKVPTTWDELLTFADEVNSHAVAPISIDGGDGWPLMIFFSDILYSFTGSEYETVVDNAISKKDFSDPRIKKALEYFVSATKRNLFQEGFERDDYGTAQNIFLSGKAAMYYIGSWETSMFVNKEYGGGYSESNIRITKLPTFENAAKDKNSILGWYGGGYAISEGSKHKKEALDFFNYMFRKENLSKIGLEQSVGISAQDESEYLNDDIPFGIQQLVKIAGNDTQLSGSPVNDRGDALFKEVCEKNIQKLAVNQITIEEFIQILEKESSY